MPISCLNLELATAVFQPENIIHDALLAVGHKPDKSDGLILRIGAQFDDEAVKSFVLASRDHPNSLAVRFCNGKGIKRSFSTLYLRLEALLHPVTATATTDGKRVSVHAYSFPSQTTACIFASRQKVSSIGTKNSPSRMLAFSSPSQLSFLSRAFSTGGRQSGRFGLPTFHA